MKKLMMLVALAGTLCAAGDDSSSGLLYWSVADNSTPFAYAQIMAVPSSGSKTPLAVVDADGNSLGSAVFANGYLSSGELGTTISPVWSMIEMSSGVQYLIELYGQEGKVAWSQTATAGDLSGYVKTSPTDRVSTPWSPSFIPEPSSALLLLFGGALMGLRRKRRA